MRQTFHVPAQFRQLPRFWPLAVLAGCVISAHLSAAGQSETYHYRQTGWGRPVVVFEHGLGDRLETWKSVQDDVSLYAETFSYNRAGYEASPAATGTRDAATAVGELRALLAQRGLEPPYLLVGHSLGGLFMQYFARNYPGEVAGLVLVDSSHWDMTERIRRVAPWLAAEITRERRKMPGVLRMEAEAFDTSGREVDDSPPLRSMPLVVLCAGRYPPATNPPSLGSNVRARRRLSPEFWLELQLELADQLPDSQLTIARNSGHFIQNQQPEIVSAAVRDMILDFRLQTRDLPPRDEEKGANKGTARSHEP
jgi:pimeloyl-ACP methyl ester carboxylesterase